jgi:hypothetical protein
LRDATIAVTSSTGFIQVRQAKVTVSSLATAARSSAQTAWTNASRDLIIIIEPGASD